MAAQWERPLIGAEPHLGSNQPLAHALYSPTQPHTRLMWVFMERQLAILTYK